MNDRSKDIERLQEAMSTGFVPFRDFIRKNVVPQGYELLLAFEHQRQLADDYLQEIDYHKSQVPQWISLSEKEPKKHKSYLCYTGNITIVLYFDGLWWTPDGNLWGNTVEFYQTLPTYPI